MYLSLLDICIIHIHIQARLQDSALGVEVDIIHMISKQLFDYVISTIQYGKNFFFIRSFTNLCFIQGTCFFPAVFIEIVIINMPIFVRDLCMCSRRGDEKNQQQKKEIQDLK